MRVAVPSEVKNHEYRVAITPVGVAEDVYKRQSQTDRRWSQRCVSTSEQSGGAWPAPALIV